MKHGCYIIIILLGLFCCSCTEQPEQQDVWTQCHKLSSLTRAKHPVQAGEWRDSYTEVHEPYKAYVQRNPTSATSVRKVLYVVQLGAFDSLGQKIMNLSRRYLSDFYQIEVKELPPVSTNVVAPKYRRSNTFGEQIRTGILLDSLLPALLPADAFALIAFTPCDLYPSDDWNFVFGQASLERRVGVWSLARLGDYNRDSQSYTLCLRRTLKVAIHETGHMFGIRHCVQNECCMNGSNSLAESDKQVPWLCWECLAKICWNRQIRPAAHIGAMLRFQQQYLQDTAQQSYYRHAAGLLN